MVLARTRTTTAPAITCSRTARRRAQGASVASYLFDLQRLHLPDVTARLRIVPTIEPAPISPVIPYSRKARLT